MDIKKSKIKDLNHIIIKGFMVNQLKLKGNDLLIYAIIHGFSQDNESRFTGSLQYLADWTNSTKQGVIKSLQKLQTLGYISKNESFKNGIKFCEYHATEFNTPLNLVEHPIKQSLIPPIKLSLPNNIVIDNKEDIKEDRIGKIPTFEEFKNFALSKEDLYVKIDLFKLKNKYDAWEVNGWKDGHGKKITNWKSKLLNTLQYLIKQDSNQQKNEDSAFDEQAKLAAENWINKNKRQ